MNSNADKKKSRTNTPGFVTKKGIFLFYYFSITIPIVSLAIILDISDEIRLTVMYCVAAITLPFIVVPTSRWMTKLTFWEMKILSRNYWKRRNSQQSKNDVDVGFLTHLKNNNSAVALIRASYIIALTFLFYRMFTPWAVFVQEKTLYSTDQSGLMLLGVWVGVGVVADFFWFALSILFGGLFCTVNVMITVLLFNYVTRDHLDYYEIQKNGNVSVAIVYVALVLATFFVCTGIASRILPIILFYHW